MNEVTDPNMFKATLLTHLKANMSKFQISPQYGLSAFHMPIIIIIANYYYCFWMFGRVIGGQQNPENPSEKTLVLLTWLWRARATPRVSCLALYMVWQLL